MSRTLCTLLLGVGLAASVAAQEFPSQPIKMIIP